MGSLIQHTDFPGLDIITANMKLLKANLEVLLDQTRQQQTRLKKALEQVRDQYDFCVIDNAPDINISTINALVASNDVIVPLEVDDNTTEGLAELAEQGDANLTLMGIEPTYPSEKYGYIIPEHTGALSPVSTFKEKPDVRTAEEYISQGALWNGGVFAYRLGYVLSKAHELIDFVGYQDLYDNYQTLNKISFDYAVVEKENNIQVMRFAGEWKDLGTWNTLTEAMEERLSARRF